MTLEEMKTVNKQLTKWLQVMSKARIEAINKLPTAYQQEAHRLIDEMREDKNSMGSQLRCYCHKHGLVSVFNVLDCKPLYPVTTRGCAEAWHAFSGYIAAGEDWLAHYSAEIERLTKPEKSRPKNSEVGGVK